MARTVFYRNHVAVLRIKNEFAWTLSRMQVDELFRREESTGLRFEFKLVVDYVGQDVAVDGLWAIHFTVLATVVARPFLVFSW